MNTRDIIAVRKVCELGNLSRAAVQLYLTPQALSLIVKKVENELGVPLFNRVTGGMTLTKYGKLFFEKSERLIQELKELEEMFRLDISNEKGIIRLGVALGIIAVIMPETIWKFSERYPNFTINVIEGTDYKVEELVRRDTVDVGIAKGPVNTDEFDVIPWCSFEQCALLNIESDIYRRIGGKECISILDLKDEALILENKDFKVHKKLQNLCKNWGVHT